MPTPKNIPLPDKAATDDIVRQAIISGVILCIIVLFKVGIEIFAAPRTTDELLEAEWNDYTYGPPAITLSLPEKLKPQTPHLPEDLREYLSEIECYRLKEEESYTVSLTCVRYYTFIEASIKDAARGGITEIENSKGISNVKFTEVPYAAGTTKGIMQYGTLIENDEPMEFTSIYLTRKSNLWQIFLTHQRGDVNGRKVSERILKSLKTSPA